MGGASVAAAFYSRRRATENLSGRNLVVYTVRTELLPAMDPATGMQENAVALGGFFVGITLFLALQILLPVYKYWRRPFGGDGTQR